MSTSTVTFTTQNTSTGIFLDISGLQITTGRINVDITTTPTAGLAGSGKGLTNYVQYIPIGTTTANFYVPVTDINNSVGQYTVNVIGKTVSNGFIANNYGINNIFIPMLFVFLFLLIPITYFRKNFSL